MSEENNQEGAIRVSYSQNLNELATAMAKAQAEIGTARKDAENPFFKKPYADLASIWEACRSPLSKHGLSIVQLPFASGRQVTVWTMLLHSSGQFISGELTMSAVKDDPQSIGSCLTYLRRYSLAAVAGVAPAEDDGNAAAGNRPYSEHRFSNANNDDDSQSHPPSAVKPSKRQETREWLILKDLLVTVGATPGKIDEARALIKYVFPGVTLEQARDKPEDAKLVIDAIDEARLTIQDIELCRESFRQFGLLKQEPAAT